jgi:2-phosphosulfolactate phosphatase
MTQKVVIDFFPDSTLRYKDRCAVVAVDVIRATTTIATAVSMGRRCFPVPTPEAARRVSIRLRDPLLAGELRGVIPRGFEINNSPAELASRTDISRPLVLLSSSGTKLIHLARGCEAAYIACFRNFDFLSNCLCDRHSRIALIGAGSRGERREEDQMCCAWMARRLMDSGYAAENRETDEMVERWNGVSPDIISSGPSADYLRRSGQDRDLVFILTHIADLEWGFALQGDEVVGFRSREDELAYSGTESRTGGNLRFGP